MVIYIEADEEIIYADTLQYALAFVQDRFNKGARTFYVDTQAKPKEK